VVVTADADEVLPRRRPAGRERDDVVDLQPIARSAARHDAHRISTLERAPEARGDRAPRVRDRTHVDTVGHEHLEHCIVGQPARDRDRHRPHAADLAALARHAVAVRQRRVVDVDVHGRARTGGSHRSGHDAHEGVGGVRVVALAATLAARLGEHAARSRSSAAHTLAPSSGVSRASSRYAPSRSVHAHTARVAWSCW
jgi:hypothetical protein